MSKIGAVLSGRIRDELLELARVVDRAEQGWKKAKTKHDDYYLDGVALNLHSFYSGLEHIFELHQRAHSPQLAAGLASESKN